MLQPILKSTGQATANTGCWPLISIRLKQAPLLNHIIIIGIKIILASGGPR